MCNKEVSSFRLMGCEEMWLSNDLNVCRTLFFYEQRHHNILVWLGSNRSTVNRLHMYGNMEMDEKWPVDRLCGGSGIRQTYVHIISGSWLRFNSRLYRYKEKHRKCYFCFIALMGLRPCELGSNLTSICDPHSYPPPPPVCSSSIKVEQAIVLESPFHKLITEWNATLVHLSA